MATVVVERVVSSCLVVTRSLRVRDDLFPGTGGSAHSPAYRQCLPLMRHTYRFAGQANPSTSPRIRKKRYTLCPEWTIIDIQVLRKRLAGSAYRNAPLPIDPKIPQGWCR